MSKQKVIADKGAKMKHQEIKDPSEINNQGYERQKAMRYSQRVAIAQHLDVPPEQLAGDLNWINKTHITHGNRHFILIGKHISQDYVS